MPLTATRLSFISYNFVSLPGLGCPIKTALRGNAGKLRGGWQTAGVVFVAGALGRGWLSSLPTLAV
jgi:hypothetical protein